MTPPERSADPAVTAAAEHVIRVMNDGWLALVLSLGERLGLHVQLAGSRPLTSEELADRAGCDARYVREWLWAMVAGGMVDAVPGSEPRFRLRPGYADALTPAGGTGHWSRITTQITALAALEDHLVKAFASGEGLPPTLYEGHVVEVLAVESGPIFARVLLDEVLPLLGLTDRLERGATVLDVGCGTGQALVLLAQRFGASTFIGLDQSPDSVAATTERARTAGVTNVTAEVADLEDDRRPFGGVQGPVDLVLAANVVHDLADPEGFFVRARRLLAPAGVLYLHELGFGDDMARNAADEHAVGVLAFSLYHCLPLAKRRPGIAPGGMWGRGSYLRALAAAGFRDVTVHQAPSDPHNDTILARVPALAEAD